MKSPAYATENWWWSNQTSESFFHVERRPQLWIVAGPNGAGKSTLGSQAHDVRPVLDPDAICRKIRQRLSWLRILVPSTTFTEATDYIAVVFVEAVVRVSIWLKRSVAFETVLSSLKYEKHLQRARRRGFKVNMIFVALPNPELHVQRVNLREQAGGHGVPPHKVRKRWPLSHANLRAFLPYLDTLRVFSNARLDEHNHPMPELVAEKRGIDSAVELFMPEELPEVTRQLKG